MSSTDYEAGDLSGSVSDYGEGFFIPQYLNVDEREAYGEFTNSENQEVHRFYNDEDGAREGPLSKKTRFLIIFKTIGTGSLWQRLD